MAGRSAGPPSREVITSTLSLTYAAHVERIKQQAVTWQEVEGEIVCLDLASSQYLSINASGAALWSRLLEGAERDVLARHLMDTFDISESRAYEDVDTFLGELGRRGLLDSQ